MLIIEGADKLGKTTFAKRILKKYRRSPSGNPIHYRWMGMLPGHWDYYGDYINRIQSDAIQDRFYLSEYVYGNVLRGVSPLSLDTINKLNTDLQFNGVATVIVTATPELLKARLTEHKDDRYNVDQILAVNDKFRSIAQHCDSFSMPNCLWIEESTFEPWLTDRHVQNAWYHWCSSWTESLL